MRFQPIALILMLALLVSNSCQNRKSESECFPGKSEQLGTFKMTKSKFLPGKFFDDVNIVDKVDTDYASIMNGLKESSLLTVLDSDDEEVYRFVWLRSFDNPISLRIQKSFAKILINIKEHELGNDDNFGALIVDRKKDVSIPEWINFKKLLAKECFWTLDIGKDLIGIDGSVWILEAKKENRYHVVYRRSPERGNFRAACLYLLELSELNINESKIY